MTSSRLAANLFANCPNVTDFERTFYGCSNLTSIPGKLFINCSNVITFDATFYECSSLTSIPEKLFDNCEKVEEFGSTFAGCTSLTGDAPELWKRGTNSEENNYRGNPDGNGCFRKCEKLNQYDEIPNYWSYGMAM